jgi:periplasmic divalent cation tolerance protein
MRDALVVLCTFPSDEVASDIARLLLERRLAACVHLFPTGRSLYHWEGTLCDDAEVTALCKTTPAAFATLRDALVDAHPYDCPEVLALPVADGHDDYLRWLTDAVQPPSAP